MQTRAPATSSPRAIISPIPREPPVTRALLPASENRSVRFGRRLGGWTSWLLLGWDRRAGGCARYRPRRAGGAAMLEPGAFARRSRIEGMTPPIRVSVLDQSPIAEGSSGAQALRNTHRPRAARRCARLPPLLGGRAPRRADARRGQPRGADRADRRRHDGPAGRQWRRDAAPLQPAEGGRVLLDACRPVSRAHRSRPRPRGRHRPADHVRAAARPPPGGARRLPAEAGRAARLPRRHAARGPSRSGAWPRRSRAPERPEPWLLGSSPQSAIWAGQLGLPYAFADFINRDGAEIAASYRAEFAAPPGPRRPPHGGRRLGDRRRQRRGGAAAGVQQPHDASRCCAAAS